MGLDQFSQNLGTANTKVTKLTEEVTKGLCCSKIICDVDPVPPSTRAIVELPADERPVVGFHLHGTRHTLLARRTLQDVELGSSQNSFVSSGQWRCTSLRMPLLYSRLFLYIRGPV